MIADTHAHLDMPQFADDSDQAVSRAREAGVDLILTVATAKPGDLSVARTLQLLERHDVLLAAVGVHPHDAQAVDEAYLAELESLAANPRIVVWGEIGLDYYYDNSPREIQRAVFRRQLRIARRLGLPVTIHCRDAWEDLEAILREEWAGNPPGGILHSFSGTEEKAAVFANLGFLISFSGMITFKKAAGIRQAARCLRADQVLVETDCPYLAPVPHRGRRNEPAFVVDVARGLAEAMGLGTDELARATSDNFARLLGIGRSDPVPAGA